MSKLQDLMDIEGYDDEMELLEEYSSEGIVPGICTNEGCDCTFHYEPDCRDGWCDCCETNTVESCLSLAGIT